MIYKQDTQQNHAAHAFTPHVIIHRSSLGQVIARLVVTFASEGVQSRIGSLMAPITILPGTVFGSTRLQYLHLTFT